MELETSKSNHVKHTIALTSTIALLSASVGVSHHVKADDLKKPETKETNTNDDKLEKPETLEDAQKAVADTENQLHKHTQELADVTATIAETQEEISQLEIHKDEQTKTLEEAQSALDEAKEISDENLAVIVDQTKAELAATTTALEQANSDSQAKQADVTKQDKSIAVDTAEANALADKVAEASQHLSALDDLSANPDSVSVDAKAATELVNTISAELTSANSDLEKVKSLAKELLQNDLASHKKELARTDSELKALEQNPSTTTVNVAGSNKMIAPENYPFDLLQKLAASGYIGSESYNRYYNQVVNDIVSRAQSGNQTNQYVDIPNDINRVVDPDHLSEDVQDELAQFAAQMLNSVRQQFGMVPVVVTKGSQEFARLLTTSYKQTHGSIRPSFVYGQPGVSGHYGIGPHDRTIIEASATEVGLRQNDDNMYENIGAFNDIHTVNGIKRGIYNSIKYMLFTDNLHGNTYGHAVNFLRTDKTNPKAPVYLGVSTSNVQSLNEHFVIFPESDIVNRARFSTVQVSPSGQLTDHSAKAQGLKAKMAKTNEIIQLLEGRLSAISEESQVKVAQEKVNQLQKKLEIAKATAKDLNKRLDLLAQTKDGLQAQKLAAEKNHATLKAELDNLLAKLASSKVVLNDLKKVAEQAQIKVSSLEAKKNQLEHFLAFNTDPNRVAIAQEKVSQSEKALAEVLAHLASAKTNLQNLTDQKARLESNIATTEQQLILLKSLVQEKQPPHVSLPTPSPRTTPSQMVHRNYTPVDVQIRPAKVEKPVAGEVVKAIESQVAESTPEKPKAKTSLSEKPQETASASKAYGTDSKMGSKNASGIDETTKRAIAAGVVMLAAVGIAGAKLRKDKK